MKMLYKHLSLQCVIALLAASFMQLEVSAGSISSVCREWNGCIEIDNTKVNRKRTIKIDDMVVLDIDAMGPPPIPLDNPQPVDENGWPLYDVPMVQLGKMLFFEPALSGDGSVPCDTCHRPDEGWGLNSEISRGYPGISHWRNSHTVLNSAYMKKLFWDGHEASLESQAPSAAQGLSGNGKVDMMEQRLRAVPEYRKLFTEVFGSDLNVVKDSWRAIAAFERALTTHNTPFDQYMRGDEDALDDAQKRGLKLFRGKAKCIKCHNGQMFSDEKNYNLGLPRQVTFLEDHLQQAGFRSQTFISGVPEEVFRKTKFDTGMYLRTHIKKDMGLYRTQPLRHLEYTAPYMHNGVFDTLEDVVDFYNDGGESDKILEEWGFGTKTKLLVKLELSDEEKEDLVSFLDSLSGDEILMETPTLPGPVVSVVLSKK